MSDNRLPKKGLVDSVIYLNDQFKSIKRELCCNTGGGGGLTQVYTNDSDSVSFSGDGTQSNPLMAFVSIPSVDTIYSANGTIAVNRTVTVNAQLLFSVTGSTRVNLSNQLSIWSDHISLTAAGMNSVTVLGTRFDGTVMDNTSLVQGIGISDFAVGGNVPITNIDSIVGALGKAQGQINARASLASPTFTGTPIAPTALQGTNTTQIATTAFVTTAINSISGGSGITRPSSPTIGQMFFDTSLPITKPIWYNGTVWVDATGTTVP